MEMKPTLLILAAGIGSRYGGLKQADGVGPSGEAILDYSICDAIRAGFGKVVFIIRKDIEDDMKQIFFDRWSKKIEIDYVFQEVDNLPGGFQSPAGRTKPWGTGHAIWVAKDKIKEPFCVINADDFYGRGAYQLTFTFLSDIQNLINSRYCLIGYILKNSLSEHGFVSRAECRTDDKGMLAYVKERTKIKREGNKVFFEDEKGTRSGIDENTIVSMNMWGFMPSLFDYLEEGMIRFLKDNSTSLKAEYFLPSLVDELIKDGKVEVPVLQTDEKWFGMTYQEDREMVSGKLADLVKQGLYPTRIWE
jgi:UTP-glucose-1-phosphate uridylyltransferase